MNFLWMEYFSAVAKNRSIHKAAEQLSVSDQAVSEVIKKLEKELETRLLSHTRPQTVTPAGTIFLQYATQILQLKQEMLTEISETCAGSRANAIRIGVVPLGAPYFLPALVDRFHRCCPDCQVEVIPQSSMDPADFSGADLYFPPLPLVDILEHAPLFSDTLCVLVSQTLLTKTYGDHWKLICQDLRTGQLDAFQSLPFIDLSGSSTRSFSAHNRKAPVHPVFPVAVNSFSTAFSLCTDGYGALLATKGEISHFLSELSPEEAIQLKVFPLDFPVKLAISYRKGKRLSPLERAFIQCAQDFFHKTTPLQQNV